VRYLKIPDRGLVAVYTPAEIVRHRPLFTGFQFDWHRQIAASVMPGACSGLVALVPHIYLFCAPLRVGVAKVQRYTIMEPGLSSGTELWEPMVDEWIARLKEHGLYAHYDATTTSHIDAPTLQRFAAQELCVLRAKVALR
jgi:hypothetical protein